MLSSFYTANGGSGTFTTTSQPSCFERNVIIAKDDSFWCLLTFHRPPQYPHWQGGTIRHS
jgi:hypothetical protein